MKIKFSKRNSVIVLKHGNAVSRYFLLSTLSLLLGTTTSFADNGFNPAFIEQDSQGDAVADLSAFSKSSGGQLPGKYLVDIRVNNEIVDHQEITFYADTTGADINDTGLLPCLSQDQLKKYGVKPEAFTPSPKNDTRPAGKDAPTGQKECVPFLQTIPSSSAAFDFNHQTLDLSFPQAILSNSVRGYVDPSLWDDGVPAFVMDYNFTGANGENESNGSTTQDDSYYLSLRSGFNLGPWRLRNYSTWNDNNGDKRWQNVNTYLQRSIISLKSQLTLGDGYSTGDVFDSVQFRGAQIASDDSMLPDSMQGFAPVVRGIAKSNAQVTVSQNGYTIYQSYVAPGAFEITDLYQSSGSGDLTVEVKEEDGSIQRFIQPYASVPLLQREGHMKYSLTAGQYRSGYDGDNPDFGQFTLIRGFSQGMTFYGGLQGSEKYQSLAVGMGKNIGDWGAISVDVTQAKTRLPGDVEDSGQSYRFLYAKSFAGSGTDFRLLGYRYSTSGFYTLQESVDLNADDSDDSDFDLISHKRSQIEGSVNQTLPEDWGSFYFSASIQDYWNADGNQQTLQLGYNNSWRGITYSISVSDNYTPDEPTDRQIAFNVSVPLDRWMKGAWATYNMNTSTRSATQNQVGVNGVLDDDKLNYSVSQTLANSDSGGSGNTSMSYTGRRGNSSLGYSYSDNSRRWNYGLEGGVVVHSQGITLAQPLGDTIALIAAPGADDVNVVNNSGVTTDSRGYAVVPYTTPYRHNRVGLDTTSLGANVDLEESAKDVIPTRGAVVRADFTAHVGYRLMMNLTRADGKAVPFGTVVALVTTDSKKAPDAGVVGEMGSAYLNGLPESGQLIAQWGNGPDKQCKVSYKLTQKDIENTLPVISAKCS